MPEIHLIQLAGWIAEQLGWQTLESESYYSCALTHTEEDMTMKLWLSTLPGRLKISADSLGLYEFRRQDEHFPSITCSLAKTPPQIARDIERRVIPDSRKFVKTLLDRKAVHDERKRKQQACCQQIADMLRAEMREGQGRDSDPRVYCYGKGTSAIEFIVSTDNSVHIEIRCAPFEAAMQIAHTTQEWLRYGWTKENEQTKLEQEQEETT